MALDTIVAGPYRSTYGGAAVGLSKDGYRIETIRSKQEIKGDAYGDSVIELITRGANVFMEQTSIVWKAGSLAPFKSYGNDVGEMWMAGLRESDYAAEIVLTADSADTNVMAGGTGSTAYSIGAPATLTAALATLAPGHVDVINLQSMGREFSTRYQFLPYLATSYKWFSVT